MNVASMLEELNREIARLTQIRDLLGATAISTKAGPGRPRGSGKQTAIAGAEEAKPKRRIMSAEARERIAAAQRKRWAAAKKASKPPAKPGIVKPIRATPPVASKAARSPQPAKKSPPPAKQASGKAAPPKKAAKQAPAKKQPAIPTPAPASAETATAGE